MDAHVDEEAALPPLLERAPAWVHDVSGGLQGAIEDDEHARYPLPRPRHFRRWRAIPRVDSDEDAKLIEARSLAVFAIWCVRAVVVDVDRNGGHDGIAIFNDGKTTWRRPPFGLRSRTLSPRSLPTTYNLVVYFPE